MMTVVQRLPTSLFMGVLLPSVVLSAEVSITMTPSTLTLTPDQADERKGYVEVTCRVPVEGLLSSKKQLEMSISRVLADRPTESIIVLAELASGGVNLLTDLPGANVFVAVKDRTITLTLGRAGCGDAGLYNCTAEFNNLPLVLPPPAYDLPERLHSSDNLTVHVTPGPLTLTRSPSGRRGWEVGDVLNMSCQGPLGTLRPEQEVEWVWEFQDVRARNAPWRLYDGDVTDVESGPVVPHQHCYVRGSSTLTRRLTLEDSDRQYRCYVKLGGVSFQQYAAAYKVGTVRSTGSAELPIQHPVFVGFRMGGMAVGLGVVGAVVVVVVVVVVIIWTWRHQRQLSLMRMRRTPNMPPLPEHRDPDYYGEYLEPIVPRPSDEGAHAARAMYDSLTVSDGDQRASNYSQIPIYEDLDLDNSQSCCACIPAL